MGWYMSVADPGIANFCSGLSMLVTVGWMVYSYDTGVILDPYEHIVNSGGQRAEVNVGNGKDYLRTCDCMRPRCH